MTLVRCVIDVEGLESPVYDGRDDWQSTTLNGFHCGLFACLLLELMRRTYHTQLRSVMLDYM